jgi:hypothetical protein
MCNQGKWRFTVNICNEYTTAQEIVEMALLDDNVDIALAKWNVLETGKMQEVRNQQHSKQAQNRPAQQQQQTNEVVREPVIDPSVVILDEDSLRRSGVPILEYDYRKSDEYKQRFLKKPVAFYVSHLKREIKVKKSGDGTYEVINVYGWYNGLPADKPIYDLMIWPSTPDKNWGNGRMISEKLPGRLDKPGDTVAMNMYLLMIGKRHQETNDWRWDMTNIIPGEDSQQSISDESDAPDWAQDEVPFDIEPEDDPGQYEKF